MEAELRDIYREYRARIDAREVLARYGARNCTETTNSRDGTTEIVHSCLIDLVEPHHRNGDAHPSAWMNIDKGLYVCAAYWSGDLIRLVQKLEGKETLEETLPIVGEMLSGATKGTVEFQDELAKIFAAHKVPGVSLSTYSPGILNRWATSHPYLYQQREISTDTLEALHVGFDATANRITIPYFHHGKLIGWQKRAIPAAPGQWPGTEVQFPKYKNCVPIDTEILTERGWLIVDNLQLTDRVASVNDQGHLQYQLPLQVNRHHHDGDLVRISTKHSEQLMTEDHSVWVKARRYASRTGEEGRGYVRSENDAKRCPRCGEWKPRSEYPTFPSQVGNYCIPCWKTPTIALDEKMFSMRAAELFDSRPGEVGWEMPHAAVSHEESGVSLGGLEWSELLGWVASDGSVGDDVRIYQSKAMNVGRIRGLFDKARIGYREHVRVREHSGSFPGGHRPEWVGRRTQEHLFYVARSDPFSEKAMEMGREKLPPWEWLGASQEECTAFFEGFRGGDGVDWCGNSTSISQKDCRVMDWLQALCVQLGMRTKLVKRADRDCYDLSVCRRDSVLVGKSQRKKWLSRRPFSGEVWCPTTVDGTWVARRNGCVFVTGNSSGFPKSEVIYQGDVLKTCASGMALVLESPLSVIKAWDLGLFDPCPVATAGSAVSATQIDILSDSRAVFIWFDADAAGYKGTRTLVEGLMNRTQVMVVIPDPEQDLGDYSSLEAAQAKLDSAMPAALWLGMVQGMEN